MSVVDSRRALEVQLYWRVMREGVALASLTEYQDELDVLKSMTGSSVLRELCVRNGARFAHLGSTVRVANG